MPRRPVLSAALAMLLFVAVPHAADKRFITEKDLLKFTWIADPQISPDGSNVAFVRVTVNEKENRYETSLFTVATSGAGAPRRITSSVRDTAPRWQENRVRPLGREGRQGAARAGVRARHERGRGVCADGGRERRHVAGVVAERKNDCLHRAHRRR